MPYRSITGGARSRGHSDGGGIRLVLTAGSFEALATADGVTPETMRTGLGRAMVVDVIASLIMAFALANIIGATGITDWFNGAMAGFWVWLGFIATMMVSLWGYENRSLKLIAINLGNNLIALVLMGALLAVWR